MPATDGLLPYTTLQDLLMDAIESSSLLAEKNVMLDAELSSTCLPKSS